MPVDERLNEDLGRLLEKLRDDQISLLSRLVQTQWNNPPDTCAAHGVLAAELLEQLGFEVEGYLVPAGICREYGMKNATNFIVRERFASVHASTHNHFDLDRHLVPRDIYKQSRSAALAEWRELLA